MKSQTKFSLNKIKYFLIKNTPIMVILLVLFSLISLMLIQGFKLDYDSYDTSPPSSILVEDRVPALALYYQRDRVNVNIILADPSELEPGEVLENITFEARYNSNRSFDEAFKENDGMIPLRENYLFTHFSLTPNGEPLNPSERITEEITIYANWTVKPTINPWQVLARVAIRIELGSQTYLPYKYSYHLINKGEVNYIDVPTMAGFEMNEYKVRVRVDGKETRKIVDANANYNSLNRHNITFDLNGGTLPVPTQKTVYSIPHNGLVLESPGVAKEGYRFLGWSLVKDGNSLTLQDVIMDQDVVVYAKYTPIIDKPNPNTGTGRYQTTYYLESIDYNSAPIALMSIDRIGTINEHIEAEELEFPNFTIMPVDLYSHKTTYYGAQFLIVPKKDKVFSLNEKIMSFTETNPAGVIALLMIFGILVWTFIDNKQYNNKFLGWGILLLATAILIFFLPQLVKFSVYFQNIWDISKELNPDGTKITALIGIKLSGTLLLIASIFSFATYVIALISDKKDKKVEVID